MTSGEGYLIDECFPDGVLPAGDPAEIVGIASGATSLYEFETSDGTFVSLHELDCTGIEVRPLDQTVTIAFGHESRPDPVLHLHLGGARVLRWRLDLPLGPVTDVGQVSDLWWDGGRLFALYLADDEIAISATTVTVVTVENFPDLRLDRGSSAQRGRLLRRRRR